MNRFVLLLFVIATLFAAVPLPAASAEISDIRFETTPAPELKEKVRIKMDIYQDALVFGLQGDNPRLVCDFFGIRPARGLKNISVINGKLIRRIRIGIHPQPKLKTRLVLDLFPNQDYLVYQLADREDNILTIVVELAGDRPAREGNTTE